MSIINPLAATVPVAPATTWQTPREGREHDLRMEQIVRASVAEGGQERVLLEMGQRRFWAESAIPLKTGQNLSLQVVSLAPRLALKVVEDPVADRLGRLLHLLGGKWDLAAALTSLAGGSPPAGEIVDAGRILFGQMLKWLTVAPEDLNGDLLRRLLRAFTPGGDHRAELETGGGITAFRDALFVAHRQLAAAGDPYADELVHLLQQFDLFLLCHARMAQAGLSFFPLPFPQLENGYLIAERRQTTGAEEAPFSLSLHLSLSGLGAMRIDLFAEAQGLFLRFCCSSSETMNFLAGYHEEFKENFQALPLRGVAFVTGAESPEMTLLRRLFPAGESVLNTRV